MARPKQTQPTPAELDVLKVLWRLGEGTVRDVLEAQRPQRERAYTSVMSLLNVMVDKGLLARRPRGRAFVYTARVTEDRTVTSLVRDLLGRVFDGSPSALVAHLLEQTVPTTEELDRIHALIEAHKEKQESAS